MFCPYCGFDVGESDACSRCGTLQGSDALTGWRPDPTARHEGRYYTAGRPTDRVRDGKRESTDSAGGQLLPRYTTLPASAGARSAWLGTGGAVAVIVAVAAVVWGVLLPGPHRNSPEESYLSSLRDGGFTGQFNSEANALAHGRQVCKQLEEGGPQQGLPADKLAVDAFCPQFNGGFRILETANATGTFVLTDSSANEYTKAVLVRLPHHRGPGSLRGVGRAPRRLQLLLRPTPAGHRDSARALSRSVWLAAGVR